MIDIKNLSKEEELSIIEQGIKSDFWDYLSQKFSHNAFTAGGAALSERVERREWMAGKATGMKEALQFPAHKAREIRSFLKLPNKDTKETV